MCSFLCSLSARYIFDSKLWLKFQVIFINFMQVSSLGQVFDQGGHILGLVLAIVKAPLQLEVEKLKHLLQIVPTTLKGFAWKVDRALSNRKNKCILGRCGHVLSRTKSNRWYRYIYFLSFSTLARNIPSTCDFLKGWFDVDPFIEVLFGFHWNIWQFHLLWKNFL